MTVTAAKQKLSDTDLQTVFKRQGRLHSPSDLDNRILVAANHAVQETPRNKVSFTQKKYWLKGVIVGSICAALLYLLL